MAPSKPCISSLPSVPIEELNQISKSIKEDTAESILKVELKVEEKIGENEREVKVVDEGEGKVEDEEEEEEKIEEVEEVVEIKKIVKNTDFKTDIEWTRQVDNNEHYASELNLEVKLVKAIQHKEIQRVVREGWEEDSGEGEDSDASDRLQDHSNEDNTAIENDVVEDDAVEDYLVGGNEVGDNNTEDRNIKDDTFEDSVVESSEVSEQKASQKTVHEKKIEKPKYRSKIMEKLESMVNNSDDVFQQESPVAEIETRKPELDHKSLSEGYNLKHHAIHDKQIPMDVDEDEPTLVIKEQYTPNKPLQKEDSTKSEGTTKSKLTKPPVPKQKTKKRTAKKQAKEITSSKDVVDYSHIYSSFYDIFNSYVQNPKYFDPSIALRETRNLYSTYISLMDSNILFSAPSFKFSPAPLEK